MSDNRFGDCPECVRLGLESEPECERRAVYKRGDTYWYKEATEK